MTLALPPCHVAQSTHMLPRIKRDAVAGTRAVTA